MACFLCCRALKEKDPEGRGSDAAYFHGRQLRAALAGSRLTANPNDVRRLKTMVADNNWELWLPNGSGLAAGDSCFAMPVPGLKAAVEGCGPSTAGRGPAPPKAVGHQHDGSCTQLFTKPSVVHRLRSNAGRAQLAPAITPQGPGTRGTMLARNLRVAALGI